MIAFNLKIAFRNLWKNKVFSIVTISGLALGLACCLVITLYIWNELQVDAFHANGPQIYRITEKQDQAGSIYHVAVTPGPLAPSLQRDFPEIVNTVRLGNWSGQLKYGNKTYQESHIQLTDNSLFKVFTFPLLKGNPDQIFKSSADIVITEKLAEKYFGKDWRKNPALLGQIIRLNNETDFRLAGIAKNVPESSSIQFDVLLPLTYLFSSDKFSYQWNSNNFHTYLQLRPQTNTAAFEKKLAGQLHKYNPPTHDQLQLQPLKEQYLYSTFDFNTDWGKRGNIKYVKIFTVVGLLLLAIACVNFINLSTARSIKRAMEVGIRKVNGASRRQLIFQFLSESLLVSLIAGMIALVLINLLQPFFIYFTGNAIDTSLFNTSLLFFLMLFIIVIGLLAGSYPAFILSAFGINRMLHRPARFSSGAFYRKALVVFQFAISATLITCTFFMHRQLNFMQQTDLGFNAQQLINIGLPGQLSEKWALVKQDINNIAGVTISAPATISMVNVDNSSYLEWEGMQPEQKFLITQANIDPDFLPALNMQIISGNNFSHQLTNDTANYIVNETAVRRMGYTLDNTIGKKITFWGAKGTIIGVVKDFHFKPPNSSIEPFIFRYQPQDRYFSMFVKAATPQLQDIRLSIEKIIKRYGADIPFEYSVVQESLDASYQEDRRSARIMLLFANLTIFVGCLGLFGLTVFSSEQRVKEIGIRKVLGAGVASIAGLLSKDLLKLVAAAIFIALPVAGYLTGSWLNNYAYRISTEWWVFALVGCMVIAVALLTISFQAIRAAMANPVKSLRTE